MAEAIGLALLTSGVAEGSVAFAAGSALVANAALVNAAVTVAASAAYSGIEARNARRRARNAYNANLKDREVMVRGGTEPQRIIYGRDRVSGVLVYAESTGARKEYLHLVVALAGHECDAIETIWFNDIALPAEDGSGYINSGEFAYTETTHGLETLTANGSGQVTLAHAPSQIISVIAFYGIGAEGYNVAASYTWSSGTTVSGLTSGTSYGITYEYQTATPLVRVKKYLGSSSQAADSDLVAESASKWTSAHRGRGICYLYVRLKYHQDVFGQVGVPNVSATIRGRKVRDSRTGTTAWSNNAALCVADFLRDGIVGLGATSAQVPDSELTSAANVCDELVTLTSGGATQARYTFDGGFTADTSPLDVLAALCGAMAGAAVWTQGRWYIRPGAYRTPTVTIDADTLADGSITVQAKRSRGDLFNAVRVTHRDPDRDYAQTQAPLVSNATYQTEDGGRQIVHDMTLPLVCEPKRAQRLAKIELERSRQALTVQLATNLGAYDLAPTDTVSLTLSRYGWSAKAFEVIERTWSGSRLQYTLRETAAGVFDWNYGEATTVDLAPDTLLPSPYTRPAAITGLTVTSDASMFTRLSNGSVLSRSYATWTQSTDQWVVAGGHIDVQWRQARNADWVQAGPVPGNYTACWLDALPNNDYIVVAVRAVNASGRAGPWAYVSYFVAGIGSMPATGVFLETFSGGYAAWRNYAGNGELSIVDVSDSELGGKALRVGNNSGNDMAWLIHDANVPYKSGTLYRVRARVRRTAGSGVVYIGLAGVAADGVTLCNVSGSNSYSNQHYVAATGAAPSSSWTVYDGYVTGYAATGSSTAHNEAPSPGAMQTNVRFVRPILVLNYTGASGTTEVDYVAIDRLAETGDLEPGAATDVYVDRYDFAGATYGDFTVVRSFSLTPTDDCFVELSSTLKFTAGVAGDGNAFWKVYVSGSAVSTILFMHPGSVADFVSPGIDGFEADAGVPLDFELLTLTDAQLGESIMRVAFIKR